MKHLLAVIGILAAVVAGPALADHSPAAPPPAVVSLADNATVQGRPSAAPTAAMPTQQFEPAPVMQMEPRIQIQAPQPAAVPVGQMPLVMSYEVPTLRLRAKYKLIQPTGKKSRYNLPALSLPSYANPAPAATVYSKP